VKTGIIYSRAPADLPGAAANLGADAVLLKFGFLTRDLVKECRKRNLVIFSWAPNSPEEFKEAADLKIDGIVTDDPCRARHYFTAR
jgi:glycerophosphoryl diester phosphodiesterase